MMVSGHGLIFKKKTTKKQKTHDTSRYDMALKLSMLHVRERDGRGGETSREEKEKRFDRGEKRERERAGGCGTKEKRERERAGGCGTKEKRERAGGCGTKEKRERESGWVWF